MVASVWVGVGGVGGCGGGGWDPAGQRGLLGFEARGSLWGSLHPSDCAPPAHLPMGCGWGGGQPIAHRSKMTTCSGSAAEISASYDSVPASLAPTCCASGWKAANTCINEWDAGEHTGGE